MGATVIRAAVAALLLLCALTLIDPVVGMKLPLTKGRFGALKKLLVYVGSVHHSTNVEQWSELSGVPSLIDRASGATKLDIPFDVSATQASHIRIRVVPTPAGKDGVWGLRIDDSVEAQLSISRTSTN